MHEYDMHRISRLGWAFNFWNRAVFGSSSWGETKSHVGSVWLMEGFKPSWTDLQLTTGFVWQIMVHLWNFSETEQCLWNFGLGNFGLAHSHPHHAFLGSDIHWLFVALLFVQCSTESNHNWLAVTFGCTLEMLWQFKSGVSSEWNTFKMCTVLQLTCWLQLTLTSSQNICPRFLLWWQRFVGCECEWDEDKELIWLWLSSQTLPWLVHWHFSLSFLGLTLLRKVRVFSQFWWLSGWHWFQDREKQNLTGSLSRFLPARLIPNCELLFWHQKIQIEWNGTTFDNTWDCNQKVVFVWSFQSSLPSVCEASFFIPANHDNDIEQSCLRWGNAPVACIRQQVCGCHAGWIRQGHCACSPVPTWSFHIPLKSHRDWWATFAHAWHHFWTIWNFGPSLAFAWKWRPSPMPLCNVNFPIFLWKLLLHLTRWQRSTDALQSKCWTHSGHFLLCVMLLSCKALWDWFCKITVLHWKKKTWQFPFPTTQWDSCSRIEMPLLMSFHFSRFLLFGPRANNWVTVILTKKVKLPSSRNCLIFSKSHQLTCAKLLHHVAWSLLSNCQKLLKLRHFLTKRSVVFLSCFPMELIGRALAVIQWKVNCRVEAPRC